MLTCRGEEIDSVLGLELGADDYLTKPVRYHELIARLKNIFHRVQTTGPARSSQICRNGLEIDLGARTVDSHIRRIHRKLKDAGVPPELIETVCRIGYHFTDAEVAPV